MLKGITTKTMILLIPLILFESWIVAKRSNRLILGKGINPLT
jgi:hypothetical protein